MTPHALEIHHLTVAYNNIPVLLDITAVIPRGVLLAVIGPNGAGKTTLIKSIVGLIKPLAGTIKIQSDIQKKSAIAYIPQRSTIDWDFPATVLDVVLMGCYASLGWFKRPQKHHIQYALEALKKVTLYDYRNRPINQLSGGQQQRVFLARALMQDAPLYLLDEPFSGIDHASEKTIVSQLKELSTQGKTIIAVHHDLHTLPDYFDWVLMINRSSIACGPVSQMFTSDLIKIAYSLPSAHAESHY